MDPPFDRRWSGAGGRAGRLGRVRRAWPGHLLHFTVNANPVVPIAVIAVPVIAVPVVAVSAVGIRGEWRADAHQLGRRWWPRPARAAAASVAAPIARDVGRLVMADAGSQHVWGTAFQVWGTTASLLVTDPRCLEPARRELAAEITAMGDACDRFRPDSELSRLNNRPGRPVRVSPLFAETLRHALRVARATDGAVDPTVGGALIAAGYDRDLAEVRRRPSTASYVPDIGGFGIAVRPLSAWRAVRLDADVVWTPAGVMLDLGATAKAFAADRAAARVTRATGCGVLVSLGGDMAVGGPPPTGGWRVRVAEDHRAGPCDLGQDVTIMTGGLATSSVTVRRWRRGNRWLHHIIDPVTGAPVASCWRTVSVAAATCVDANAAATAALVKGRGADAWLAREGLPARLIDSAGSAITVAGWPAETPGGVTEPTTSGSRA